MTRSQAEVYPDIGTYVSTLDNGMQHDHDVAAVNGRPSSFEIGTVGGKVETLKLAML